MIKISYIYVYIMIEFQKEASCNSMTSINRKKYREKDY